MKRLAAGMAAAVALAGGGATYLLSADGCGADICVGDSWQAKYVAADPGDVLTVEGGTHPGQQIVADPAKATATEPVTFRPVGSDPVSIAGSLASGKRNNYSETGAGAKHVEFRGFRVNGQIETWLGSDDVTFRNVVAKRHVFTSSSNVRLLDSEIGPNVDGVSHVNACANVNATPKYFCPGNRDVLVERTLYRDFTITDPANHSECVMVWGSGHDGVTFRQVVMRNCTDFDLFVKSPGSKNIVVEQSYFDAPMPGDRNTFACNPNCPRGGNSIRFSIPGETYEGSAIRDNIVNGGIGVDCNCIPRSNNEPGAIPDVPPSPTPPPTDTTPTEPPPADSLPLWIVSQSESTVTVGWEPQGDAGYRFLVDGVSVSNTNDSTRSTVRFAKRAGARLEVRARSQVASGSIVSP